MKAILIDTTGSSLAVVLVVGDKTFSVQKDVGKSGHSAILMPTIDALFAKNNIKIDDIDTVGVVVGPGSFTGIRIGVATATALAFSLNAKRIAVTSFELLAYSRQKATVAVKQTDVRLLYDQTNLYIEFFITPQISHMLLHTFRYCIILFRDYT